MFGHFGVGQSFPIYWLFWSIFVKYEVRPFFCQHPCNLWPISKATLWKISAWPFFQYHWTVSLQVKDHANDSALELLITKYKSLVKSWSFRFKTIELMVDLDFYWSQVNVWGNEPPSTVEITCLFHLCWWTKSWLVNLPPPNASPSRNKALCLIKSLLTIGVSYWMMIKTLLSKMGETR